MECRIARFQVFERDAAEDSAVSGCYTVSNGEVTDVLKDLTVVTFRLLEFSKKSVQPELKMEARNPCLLTDTS